LLTSVLAHTASAQGLDRPPGFGQQFGDPKGVKEVAEPYILVLPKDNTRQIEMSTKELIAEFRSENPRVVKVQALLDNPRAVLVTGVGPGNTRVYITDVKKNTESLEVRVPLDEEADRENKRRELLEQIHRAVPTASVDVVASNNATVVLTGVVPEAEKIGVIMELARGVFTPAANIVNSLRVGGVQQVLLEVTVARVNRSRARNIGFSWLTTGQHHFLASTLGAGNLTATSTLPSVLAPAATLTSVPNVVFGIFNDKAGFFGYLNALTTEGLAKLIAEPRVMTLSGRPAWFASGGETPILTTSGTGAPNVSYKQFGTLVSFLPIVLGDGKIHLEVRPEVSNINAANGISLPSAVGTTTVPGFDLRSAQVAVEMEDGQTLAIGGLIQNTINAQNTKVPILGDIPVLAFAFSSKTYTETEEELLILVTPHLVAPMACCQLPKYLPGRETRIADDFELFLEGILEAPRGQRNVTHPYQAAYMNGPTSTKYPCGDTSGSHAGWGANGCNGAGSCNGTNCGATGCGPNGASPAGSSIPPSGSTPPSGSLPPSGTTPAPGPNRQVSDVRTMPDMPAVSNSATLPPVSALPTNLPQGSYSGAQYEPRPQASFGPAVLSDR
jgi:pilus assembly protein CpaC